MLKLPWRIRDPCPNALFQWRVRGGIRRVIPCVGSVRLLNRPFRIIAGFVIGVWVGWIIIVRGWTIVLVLLIWVSVVRGCECDCDCDHCNIIALSFPVTKYATRHLSFHTLIYTRTEHFFLFLIYTWSSSAYALSLFGWNYFFCADDDCIFHPIVVHLVRVMTVLCVGAFLFTSSMLMNVTYGIMTGIGTIDRLKKKATNTMGQSDEEPINLEDVFGIAGYHTWPFPIDPVFEDYDRVMGFSTPQRLSREQNFLEKKRPQMQQCETIKASQSVELPNCVNDFLPIWRIGLISLLIWYDEFKDFTHLCAKSMLSSKPPGSSLNSNLSSIDYIMQCTWRGEVTLGIHVDCSLFIISFRNKYFKYSIHS